MVFPLFDDNTGRERVPYVNYIFIILNIFVFLVPQGMGAMENRFTYAFSMVPEEIVTGQDIVTEDKTVRHPITREEITVPGLEPTPIPVYLTMITSMFMHGGWLHLIGNMLFLWIFGDNVEDDLGHFRYVLFYLVCGVLAALAHVGSTYAFGMNPRIPTLGASGAVSGILGAYLLLHPHRRVTVLLFRFITQVPAFVAIGIWFLFQIVHGLGMLGGETGGVAYGAHIGGFIAGLALVKLFMLGKELKPEPPPRGRDWR